MSKLQPSPDWFVGLDSIDLCGSGGHFVDTLTVEADPLDAGTDNGFTFTSPNWPTGVLTNAIFYFFIRGVGNMGPRPPPPPQFLEQQTQVLNQQSRFAIVVTDSVLCPPRANRETPDNVKVLIRTRLWVSLKGAVSDQKAPSRVQY